MLEGDPKANMHPSGQRIINEPYEFKWMPKSPALAADISFFGNPWMRWEGEGGGGVGVVP